MTEKLYYKNAYQVEAKCKVQEIIERDDMVEVVLDRTIFYPEGGGQPSDTGNIDGIAVVHVREKNGRIYHQMAVAPEKEEVLCKIDWDRRFHHMQQHSGEHILSGAFLKLYQGANKGFHMGEHYITIDIDLRQISVEMLEEVEREVNRHIYMDAEVWDVITDREGLYNHHPRKQVAVDENIRIVTMGEIDCCACCGTHVRRLGEIGIVKILKAETYKGMTRIYAVCGQKALEDYMRKNRIIQSLKKLLSAEDEHILQRVENLKEEMNQIKKELIGQKIKCAKEIAKNLSQSKEKLVLILEDQDFETVLQLSVLLKERYRTMIIGSAEDCKLLVETKDENLDVGTLFKAHIRNFKGKGGGKVDRAQGSFESKEAMQQFIQEVFCEPLY